LVGLIYILFHQSPIAHPPSKGTFRGLAI